MTREEIIGMAMDAWNESGNGWAVPAWFRERAEWFEAFARKVEARAVVAERVACLQICYRLDAEGDKHPVDCAKVIRARGKT